MITVNTVEADMVLLFRKNGAEIRCFSSRKCAKRLFYRDFSKKDFHIQLKKEYI